MVMGPGGLAFLAPCHPPRRAMIHAAQDSDRATKGFLRRSVLPSTVGAMASSTAMSSAWNGAVAGMNELHAHDRAAQRDDGELAQDLRRLDLAFFETEPLALEGPEQLLDVPTATIVGDGLMRLRDGVDRGAGQQPPVDWDNARRRIALAHVEGMERNALLQIAVRVVVRPCQCDRAMAHDHGGAPRRTAGNRRQVESEAIGDRESVEMLEQAPAIGQATLGLGAHQQLDRGRPPRKGRI